MSRRIYRTVALAFAAVLLGVSAIAQVRPPADVSGRGVLIGRVVDTQGTPVGRARVDLRRREGWGQATDRPNALVVIADEDGEFVFADLPAGHFNMRATKSGYLGSSELPSASRQYEEIELAADGRKLDVTLRMIKLASVTGRLTDESGAPIVGASVVPFRRRTISGRARFEVEEVNVEPSDERGEYRITNLEPGEYAFLFRARSVVRLASGTAGDPRVSSYAYPATIWPAPSRDGVIAAMKLAAGDAVQNTDFRVALAAASKVAGRVQSTDMKGVEVALEPQWTGDAAAFAPYVVGADTVPPDGTFAFAVTPGQYVLRATRPVEIEDARPAGGESVIQTATGTMTSWVNLSPNAGVPFQPLPTESLWSASMPLAVSDDGIDNLVVILQPGPFITGRFQFDGASPPPPDRLRWAQPAIEPADGVGSPPRQRQIVMAPGGRFVATNLVPGRYVVHPPQIGWTLRSVLADGRDISRQPFELKAGEKLDLVFVFTDRSSTIRGMVTGSTVDGQAPIVLSFPVDPQLWEDYGHYSRRIGVARAPQGRYAIYLPPGEYFLMATSSDPGPDWMNARNLKTLSEQAERVTVSEGEGAVINLRVVVIRKD